MKSFTYVICDEIGIHARPAGQLAKEAKQFTSVIRLSVNGKEAEARKLMSVMGLGAKKGDLVTVSAEGEDEEQAITAIENFMKANL